jgi:hypothetical protein
VALRDDRYQGDKDESDIETFYAYQKSILFPGKHIASERYSTRRSSVCSEDSTRKLADRVRMLMGYGLYGTLLACLQPFF